jgi:hypothetical protein
MEKTGSTFEKHYRDYLAQVGGGASNTIMLTAAKLLYYRFSLSSVP